MDFELLCWGQQEEGWIFFIPDHVATIDAFRYPDLQLKKKQQQQQQPKRTIYETGLHHSLMTESPQGQ